MHGPQLQFQMLEATVRHRCGSRFLRWKSLALVLSKQLCTSQLGQLKYPLRICSRAQEGYIKKVQAVGCSNLWARQAFPLRKISRSKVIWKNIRKKKKLIWKLISACRNPDFFHHQPSPNRFPFHHSWEQPMSRHPGFLGTTSDGMSGVIHWAVDCKPI